jgi:predicted nucleic acid-binding protein
VKLLVDTNVLVAALVARGTCSELLEHCVRQHVVAVSQLLLNELRQALERTFSQRTIDVRAALQLFAATFTLVTPDTHDLPRVATATMTMIRVGDRPWLASARRSSPMNGALSVVYARLLRLATAAAANRRRGECAECRVENADPRRRVGFSRRVGRSVCMA